LRQVVISEGEIRVVDVPAPALRPGALLVRTTHSLISTGTETAGLRASRQSVLQKAARRPDVIRKLARQILRGGLAALGRQLHARLRSESALGYSCSGVVLEVADDVSRFRPGDRVACAGAGQANHAEFNVVPHRLAVPVPEGVRLDEAAFVTLGAIALQGVRRCAPTLGEHVLVVGLGLIGQLTAQMLRAAGAVVIGVDVDPRRVEKARGLGLRHGFNAAEAGLADAAKACTEGRGVDAVIVTAASPDASLLDAACAGVRRKGRVVLVGDVPIRFARESIYAKELDFFISTSYGPGRYDPSYEEKGHDYPLAYVRWTETRNMEEVLRLVANRALDVRSLVEARQPVEKAANAYESLAGATRPVAVLLDFAAPEDVAPSRTYRPRVAAGGKGRVGVAVVGYGSYFRAALEPLLQAHEGFRLRAVCARTGLTVRQAVEHQKWESGSTDYREVLADPEVNLVFVTTRHNLHFPIARAALEAGKHVFVEKPLALAAAEARELADLAHAKERLLSVGFNRRFSPLAVRLKQALDLVPGPRSVLYRVDAGQLPPTSWVLDPAEGGGRIRGEGVHFFDFVRYLLGPDLKGVRALVPSSDPLNEAIVGMQFADGSHATVVYTGRGAQSPGKERVEVFVAGATYVLEDFKTVEKHGPNGFSEGGGSQDKGQRAQLQHLHRALRGEEPLRVTGDDGYWATWCAEQVVSG
jgi:predicted dehydrogenase